MSQRWNGVRMDLGAVLQRQLANTEEVGIIGAEKWQQAEGKHKQRRQRTAQRLRLYALVKQLKPQGPVMQIAQGLQQR